MKQGKKAKMELDTKAWEEPFTVKNTRCKIYTIERCRELKLTPLVTFKDKALVPDWDIVNRGRAGYAKQLEDLRKEGFAYLSGQEQKPVERPQKPPEQAETLFDPSEYTLNFYGRRR